MRNNNNNNRFDKKKKSVAYRNSGLLLLLFERLNIFWGLNVYCSFLNNKKIIKITGLRGFAIFHLINLLKEFGLRFLASLTKLLKNKLIKKMYCQKYN
jgi:hypothetical protein